MKNRSFVRLLFLAVIIMFFLPWVMVSCSGERVASATGYQLATGKYTDYENGQIRKQLGNSVDKKLASTTQILLTLVMVLSGFGILAGFGPGEDSLGAMACMSVVQSLILVGFYFKAPTLFSNALSQQAPNLLFNFQPAFYWTVALSLGCTVLCLFLLGSSKEASSQDTNELPPVGPQNGEHVSTDDLERGKSDRQ